MCFQHYRPIHTLQNQSVKHFPVQLVIGGSNLGGPIHLSARSLGPHTIRLLYLGLHENQSVFYPCGLRQLEQFLQWLHIFSSKNRNPYYVNTACSLNLMVLILYIYDCYIILNNKVLLNIYNYFYSLAITSCILSSCMICVSDMIIQQNIFLFVSNICISLGNELLNSM